jgi:hypothetical protein
MRITLMNKPIPSTASHMIHFTIYRIGEGDAAWGDDGFLTAYITNSI